MKNLWLILCAVVFGCMSVKAADIEVADAFVQIVPHNTKSAAAFMIITNNSDKDITLLSAQSTIAKSTELHQHIHQKDGMTKMVQVPQILIKAYNSTDLAPGGYHIMFINLLKPLAQGQKVSLSLHFSNDTVIELEDIAVTQAQARHTHH